MSALYRALGIALAARQRWFAALGAVRRSQPATPLTLPHRHNLSLFLSAW